MITREEVNRLLIAYIHNETFFHMTKVWQIIDGLLAERDAYREVAIQEGLTSGFMLSAVTKIVDTEAARILKGSDCGKEISK